MTDLCKEEVLLEEETAATNKHTLLIGYYNYTVILTYIGMVIGFAGVLFAGKNEVSKALICLLISGFCDMFDGAIASTRKRNKQEKRFGIQIDSLSDLICFGALPAVIVNSLVDNRYTVIVCSIYVLCALIRLSYFNVDEEERQDNSESKRIYYKGLPVTSMALILPFLYNKLPIDYMYLFVLVGASIAFLLPVEIKKPNSTFKMIIIALGALIFFKTLVGLI